MITINVDSSEPIFNQLIAQIKNAIKNNKLEPGSPLPSIRQLANDLDINNKTVAKAYKLLERDKIIESKGYKGSYVRLDAKQHCDFNLVEWVNNQLAETVARLRQAGATDSEIRLAFNSVLNN